MSYELIFLDVDGTLKQEPYTISDRNKDAILTALRAGKKVSIASGRNKDLILQTVKELRLDEAGDSFTVALNGAHIVENRTGRTLHTVPIPLQLTRFLYEKSYEYGISSHVYTENLVYFNYQDNQYEWYGKQGCRCRLVQMDREDLGFVETPLKFLLISKDREKLEAVKRAAVPVTTGILNAEFSSIYTLEFTSVHASKGLGMEYVCRLHNLPLSKVIAAGDGENDISMLKLAGLGIAMKNALDPVKASADAVTTRTCKEDGVTEIIEEYLLA
jgi:hypothetical protein